MASAPLHLARSFTLGPSHTRCSQSSSATFLGGFFISSSSLPDVRLCTASSINNMKPAIASLELRCGEIVNAKIYANFRCWLHNTCGAGDNATPRLHVPTWMMFMSSQVRFICQCRAVHRAAVCIVLIIKTTVIDMKTWPFKFIIKQWISLQRF